VELEENMEEKEGRARFAKDLAPEYPILALVYLS